MSKREPPRSLTLPAVRVHPSLQPFVLGGGAIQVVRLAFVLEFTAFMATPACSYSPQLCSTQRTHLPRARPHQSYSRFDVLLFFSTLNHSISRRLPDGVVKEPVQQLTIYHQNWTGGLRSPTRLQPCKLTTILVSVLSSEIYTHAGSIARPECVRLFSSFCAQTWPSSYSSPVSFLTSIFKAGRATMLPQTLLSANSLWSLTLPPSHVEIGLSPGIYIPHLLMTPVYVQDRSTAWPRSRLGCFRWKRGAPVSTIKDGRLRGRGSIGVPGSNQVRHVQAIFF